MNREAKQRKGSAAFIERVAFHLKSSFKISIPGIPNFQVPEASNLSTEYLIKSASTSAVEHANTLISYVAIGLDKAEKQYAEVRLCFKNLIDAILIFNFFFKWIDTILILIKAPAQ